jgi:hypothetical protein
MSADLTKTHGIVDRHGRYKYHIAGPLFRNDPRALSADQRWPEDAPHRCTTFIEVTAAAWADANEVPNEIVAQATRTWIARPEGQVTANVLRGIIFDALKSLLFSTPSSGGG